MSHEMQLWRIIILAINWQKEVPNAEDLRIICETTSYSMNKTQ